MANVDNQAMILIPSRENDDQFTSKAENKLPADEVALMLTEGGTLLSTYNTYGAIGIQTE